MTVIGWIQILLYCAIVVALVKPLGWYMTRVFNGERTFLSPVLRPVERGLYWAGGVDERREQHWLTYTVAMLLFHVGGFLIIYGLMRLQALLPLNFAAPGQAADYVLTGHWGKTAIKQAQPYVGAHVAASSEADGFRTIPSRGDWQLSKDAAYVHVTANETIHGVEFRDVPDVGDVPLFADFSSSIASEPIDVSKFGVIYAGAQKNLGPVGVTVVIIRRDLLERAGQPRADILDYRSHVKGESMLNTPPSWNWYLLGLTVKWMLAEGGVEEFARRSARKSALLYDAVDGSGGFYRNEVDKAVRSRMNVPFFLHDEALDKAFLSESKAAGLLALKGHRVVGGMRASIYNAMPEAGVQALADFMRDFQARHG